MTSKERDKWMALVESERREHRDEIAHLLDRIQHPEVRQVAPLSSEPVEPPKDAAEMAFLGQEVPEGYDVGHEPTQDELAFVGEQVPYDIKVGGSE